MRPTRRVLVVASSMLVSGPVLAQPTQPLPQHEAMAFFAGEWTFTGTYAGSSFDRPGIVCLYRRVGPGNGGERERLTR